MSEHAHDEIVCREVVELVTEYLEGSMPPGQRLLFEQHIAYCSPCVRYIEQMRQTIALAGTLRDDDLDPDTREEMLRVFREFTA